MNDTVVKVSIENDVNLCTSCESVYPECPNNNYVMFGTGLGMDNICCCSGYVPLLTREL